MRLLRDPCHFSRTMPVALKSLPFFVQHIQRLSLPILVIAVSSGSPELGSLLSLRAAILCIIETSEEYRNFDWINRNWKLALRRKDRLSLGPMLQHHHRFLTPTYRLATQSFQIVWSTPVTLRCLRTSKV